VSERGGPPVTMSTQTAWDVVYEPTQHEVYVAAEHSPDVAVFDAVTGKLKIRIPVPGWNAYQLEAAPGVVYMELGGKDGIFTIDAKTHVVAPFEIKGSFITPGEIQVDPSGQYLFMARTREIDAVNLATHTVIGRVQMFGTPSIGWDPDSHVLIASWPAVTRAYDMLMVYRLDPKGMTLLTSLKNEQAGTNALYRTDRGFLQRGDLKFLVWSATRATTTSAIDNR
jgi:DNA-binding beta-propeller fold protein YncE